MKKFLSLLAALSLLTLPMTALAAPGDALLLRADAQLVIKQHCLNVCTSKIDPQKHLQPSLYTSLCAPFYTGARG